MLIVSVGYFSVNCCLTYVQYLSLPIIFNIFRKIQKDKLKYLHILIFQNIITVMTPKFIVIKTNNFIQF